MVLESQQVTIIILTWNGLNYTKLCLDSLKAKTTYPNYRVIVVDNHSTDGTIEYLKMLDWIKLVQNQSNEGFVKGNNIGIRLTESEDVILLNNDIIITQSDWIERLRKTAYLDNKIGIVGCRLLNQKNELLHAGTYMYRETYCGQQIGGLQLDINQYNLARKVEGVVFATVYIKREVLNDIGLLDEDYFSYFEDTDYCFKAQQKGYEIYCAGDVTLIHFQNVSVKVNKVSFSDMYLKSQKTFKSKWDTMLSQKYTRSLSWKSLVNFPTGYAISSRNILQALDAEGVDARYQYVYGKNTPCPAEEPEITDDYTIQVIKSRSFKDHTIQTVYAQGDVFQKNTGKYKIGFTMLEVTGLPTQWVKQANCMQEIWVPSQFNLETFKTSGVKVPIHVIPLGTDPAFFNPQIKSFKTHKKFTFLSVFEWTERKAPEKLIKIFAEEFRRKEDVLLLCKIINNDRSIDVVREVENMHLPNDHAEIIFLYNQVIPNYQLGSLYTSADCFVLPTRGEGFGLPIMEAMACGLPVIATNWSAQTDFMNDKIAYPIRVKQLIDAKAKCPHYAGFQWADPEEEHLRYLLRYIYEHQAEAQQKGLAASKEILEKWTWQKTVRKIIGRLDEIGKVE